MAKMSSCWICCIRPNSLAAGVPAFHQAVDAVMQGITVSDYAEEHEELKTALTKWGDARTGFQM
jgi:ribulose 1,5-bisphosphate carboxylase large subunit-like protein